jgi:hypothetical protein
MDAWLFLLRWFHLLAGITWIGMLYYFNFVQVPFFAGAEPPVRTGMIAGGLVSRALWWFRWGAMLTFATGGLYLLQVGPVRFRLLQSAVRLVDLHGRRHRHSDVVQRLVHHLAGAAVVMASTARVKKAARRSPKRRRAARGKASPPHEHDALDPDAVLHGRREPFRLLHADGGPAKITMLLVF